MILTAAIEEEWLKDFALPLNPEQAWLVSQLGACVDVWISYRHADSADDASTQCLREKQLATVGRNKMTLVEWKTAYSRNVERVVASGKMGLRTRSELLIQQVDKHQKAERNTSLKLHSEEIKAFKNIASWPQEFWRLLSSAFSRSEQTLSCWNVRSLAQPFLHPMTAPDCAPDNALWIKILAPTDSKRMCYAERKDRYFNKQLVAVQKQPDMADSSLWQIASLFTWSIEHEDAAKLKIMGQLEQGRKQFIDSFFDTTCMRYVTEKPLTIELTTLPWLAPDGACTGDVRVSGGPRNSFSGALTAEMEKLKVMEAQGELESYKKRLALESSKHERCKIDAEEILGQLRDKDNVISRQEETWLQAGVMEMMKKFSLQGFKGQLALNTFMKQCSADACEAQPKISPDRLAHTKFIDLNAHGQKWSCGWPKIHEEIIEHCTQHKISGQDRQVILLAPTYPMYSAGTCPTKALKKVAMNSAFAFVRDALSKPLTKSGDVDSEVKIAISEVSVNIKDVRVSGGQKGVQVGSGKVTFWQIIHNEIDEGTQDFLSPFGQSWTFTNGMIPGDVSLCDPVDMHQWDQSHNASVSKVHFEKRSALALDSVDLYKAILTFTHNGCGAERHTSREMVQDAIPPPSLFCMIPCCCEAGAWLLLGDTFFWPLTPTPLIVCSHSGQANTNT